MRKRPLVERFWEKVARAGAEECWLWTAGLGTDGYGSIGVSRGAVRAHRVSWEIAFGAIPSGLCVLHKCDVRTCVNPSHLFLGTTQDNTADMVSKGRQRGAAPENNAARLYPERLPHGDDHWTRRNPERRLFGDRNPSRTRPECLARGDKNGSRRHPESRDRGDAHWTRRMPSLLKRGDSHQNSKLTAEQVREALTLKGTISNREIARRLGVTPALIGHIFSGRAWSHVTGLPKIPSRPR